MPRPERCRNEPMRIPHRQLRIGRSRPILSVFLGLAVVICWGPLVTVATRNIALVQLAGEVWPGFLGRDLWGLVGPRPDGMALGSTSAWRGRAASADPVLRRF